MHKAGNNDKYFCKIDYINVIMDIYDKKVQCLAFPISRLTLLRIYLH